MADTARTIKLWHSTPTLSKAGGTPPGDAADIYAGVYIATLEVVTGVANESYLSRLT